MRIRDDFGKETVIAAATRNTKILQVSAWEKGFLIERFFSFSLLLIKKRD